jgi:uncharacterized protein YdeI (YjbR/CyaY-like superfamily)
VCLFPSCHFLLTQKSRAYVCALILRSQEVDPQRTSDMIQEEEQAREYFEETRETLQLFCLSGWIEQFQQHVEGFIEGRLAEAAKIMALPEKEEEDIVHLHGLRRLVAGAFQEEELVQQPDHAFAYAKLDRAVIWDGRG